MSRLAAQQAKPGAASFTPPAGSFLQRKCACGTHTPGGQPCRSCAGATKGVLQRDPAPPAPAAAAPALPPLVQDMRPKPDDKVSEEALKKLAEALLETEIGKKVKAGLVDGMFGSAPQAIATGSVVAATLATLAVKHQPLPAQIPAIPLDFLKPGLSLELTWNGPVDKPTDGMAVIKFAQPAPEKKTDYAAETARIAAADAKFRAGMTYLPGSPVALQEAALQQAAMKYRGGIDIDAIIKQYRHLGAAQPAPGSLQLTPPASLQPPKAFSPFGDQFKLQLPDSPRKKEEPALQRQLSIGPSNEPLEIEADRVASQVLAGPATPGIGAAPPSIQRLSRGPSPGSAPGAEAVPDSVHRTLGGSGTPLAAGLRQDMEGRFGHDFSGVRLHTDAAAAQSAAEVNANAYTVGADIVFAAGHFSPATSAGRRLLAHELTHVVQQGGTGNGQVQAQQVVQRYTAFTTADQAAGKSLGWKHPASTELRVSDDGEMVAEDNGWGAGKDKRAWTTPARIAASNATLASQASLVKLVSKGGALTGNAPNAPKTAKSLVEIEPKNGTTGASLNLATDCGSACKEVTGSGAAGKDVAVMNSGNKSTYTTPRSYHGGDPTTPEQWSEEIFKKEFGAGLTRDQAYAKYAALSVADKTKFDQKYGMNKFAVPKVGQGITVSTEKDMPGFSQVPGASMTWNFHFAATVLASGGDYVTLENAAGWQPNDWIFFMYGPANKAQTFHEFHGATGTHGTAWSTMVVQPENTLHVETNAKDAPLLVGSKVTKLNIGTKLEITQQSVSAGVEWLDVKVESGPRTATVGKIRKSFVK